MAPVLRQRAGDEIAKRFLILGDEAIVAAISRIFSTTPTKGSSRKA